MKLSVIILSYNTANVTLECLHSVQKYLPKKDTEIIVVDNASTDNTIPLLQKENIKLIINQTNLGFSKGNNIGAKMAVGEYLLFLNSDIRLLDNSLLSMLDYLRLHPQIGAIGPRMLNPNLTPQASVFPPQTILNAFKEFWLDIPSYQKYLPPTNTPTSVFAISGGAFMLSKKLFEAFGGWNEKYFFYYEDLDFCRFLHRQNLEVVYYPSAQVVHHHGASVRKADSKSQKSWRRLIPGSIAYHGSLKHYIINCIIWSGQKFHRIFSK